MCLRFDYGGCAGNSNNSMFQGLIMVDVLGIQTIPCVQGLIMEDVLGIQTIPCFKV